MPAGGKCICCSFTRWGLHGALGGTGGVSGTRTSGEVRFLGQQKDLQCKQRGCVGRKEPHHFLVYLAWLCDSSWETGRVFVFSLGDASVSLGWSESCGKRGWGCSSIDGSAGWQRTAALRAALRLLCHRIFGRLRESVSRGHQQQNTRHDEKLAPNSSRLEWKSCFVF